MRSLSAKQENSMLTGVRRVIDSINDGLSPNDAIIKIANEQELQPKFIALMVQSVNKSLSVATLKSASQEDRAKPFAIADPFEIISAIYTTPVQEKVAMTLPSTDYSQLGMGTKVEKVASEQPEETMTLSQVLDRMVYADAFYKKAASVANQDVLRLNRQVQDHLKTAARVMRAQAPSTRTKVAQIVTNRYPATAAHILSTISNLGVEIPKGIQKSARYAIMLHEEPYISISNMYDTVRQYGEAKEKHRQIKEAAIQSKAFMSSLLGGAAARQMNSGEESTPTDVTDVVDPSVVNKLKETEALKNFYQTILWDKDMKGRDLGQMVDAYNSVVGTVNNAYSSPTVLKNLMLQNLEGGDVKDPHQLKQEVELGNALAQQHQLTGDTRAALSQ